MLTVTSFLALMSFGLSAAYFVCHDGDLMADPVSCNHYYICNHGRPVRLVCGGDTYYNPYLQKCLHRRYVDCGTRPVDGATYNNGDYNNGCDNNEGNNEGSGSFGTEYYWTWDDKGTMFNPLQTDFAPSFLARDENILAAKRSAVSPTIDDAYQGDSYYNGVKNPRP